MPDPHLLRRSSLSHPDTTISQESAALSAGGSWFALMVKSRHEKLVSALLCEKGYVQFLPLYKSHHRHAGKLRLVELPLFSSYTFCHFDFAQRWPILMIPGVLSIVGMGKTPAPVDEREIQALQAIAHTGIDAKPWPYMTVGDRVEIERGPLCGLQGLLVRDESQDRIVVSVALLQRSIAVEVERKWVRLVPARAYASLPRSPVSVATGWMQSGSGVRKCLS
jgi:transcription antitermination factor NusG